MMIALTIAILSVIALSLVLYVAKAHHSGDGKVDGFASRLQSFDVDAFRNQMDDREDEYLRERLPPAEFRSIQRERRLAAVEYVRCAGKNAAVLIRLAETARSHSDPAIAQAGERLLDNALRLRLYAFRTVPRLYAGVLFPGTRLPSCGVADAYDNVTRQTIMLGCLQYPTQKVSAAL